MVKWVVSQQLLFQLNYTMNNAANELAKHYKQEIREVQKKVEVLKLNADAEEDYELARDTYKDLLKTSGIALESLLALAEESEHPRAFEVLAGLIKTQGDVADQLMKLQKDRHKLDELNGGSSQGGNKGTINNNVYVGDTTSLQKMIQAEKNNAIEAIDV